MKVLVLDGLSELASRELETYDEVEVSVLETQSPGRLPGVVRDCEGLIVRSASKITREVLDAAERLLVVGRAGVGVDNIDLEAATEKGVLVMNVPGANAVSVAELALGLMLALARRIPEAQASLARGEWRRNDFRGAELCGKTLGLIGIGRIGREVATRAVGFGMEVLASDPYVAPGDLEGVPVRLVDFGELLERSDYLSLHVPLSPETRGILGREALAQVKPGVRIVNCARGGVLDEEALLAALEEGRVAGAALDVYESEPPAGSLLLGRPDVVAVPHIGALTQEAQERVAVQIARQVGDALTGRGIANAVNSGFQLHE